MADRNESASSSEMARSASRSTKTGSLRRAWPTSAMSVDVAAGVEAAAIATAPETARTTTSAARNNWPTRIGERDDRTAIDYPLRTTGNPGPQRADLGRLGRLCQQLVDDDPCQPLLVPVRAPPPVDDEQRYSSGDMRAWMMSAASRSRSVGRGAGAGQRACHQALPSLPLPSQLVERARSGSEAAALTRIR